MNFNTPNTGNVRKRHRDQLLDQRWQRTKSAIQIRDEFTCQKCKAKDATVHVHHRHYLIGRDLWDYPESLLILLCQNCHQDEERCAEILKEMIPALHNYGFFNTDIRDFVNKLIESKISTNGKGMVST